MTGRPGTYAEERTEKFRWWRADGKAFSPRHHPALKEHALKHIHMMTDEGYTSGQLLLTTGGIDFEGWWEVTE